jgi:hypothetical protein
MTRRSGFGEVSKGAKIGIIVGVVVVIAVIGFFIFKSSSSAPEKSETGPELEPVVPASAQSTTNAASDQSTTNAASAQSTTNAASVVASGPSKCEMTCKSYMGNPNDPGNSDNKGAPGFTVYNYVAQLGWAIELDASTGCFPAIIYKTSGIKVGNASRSFTSNKKDAYNWIVEQLNSQLGYKLATI